MSVSANYATPVMVNGYSCKNCTDVDNAKKHIDPARPQDGPFGIDKKDDPARPDPKKADQADPRGAAVSFGGALAKFSDVLKAQTGLVGGQTAVQNSGLSTRVDISV
jgi:hypothetical protein